MTPTTKAGRAFDWNKVGPELDAVSEAIAETVDADNIMQTNEASMEFLEYLWGLGYRVARADEAEALRAALRDIEGRGCEAAVWHDIPDRWLVCMDPEYNDDEPTQPCPPCTARAALATPASPEVKS